MKEDLVQKPTVLQLYFVQPVSSPDVQCAPRAKRFPSETIAVTSDSMLTAYLKVKVPSTQDKHHISGTTLQKLAAAATGL